MNKMSLKDINTKISNIKEALNLKANIVDAVTKRDTNSALRADDAACLARGRLEYDKLINDANGIITQTQSQLTALKNKADQNTDAIYTVEEAGEFTDIVNEADAIVNP